MIPIEVVQIPVRQRVTQEQVIKALGVPDTVTRRFVKWPGGASINDIYYSTTNEVHGISVEQWEYKVYPGAILDFGEVIHELWRCVTPAWHNLSDIQFQLEQASSIAK